MNQDKKHCERGGMYDSQCSDCIKANEPLHDEEWEKEFDKFIGRPFNEIDCGNFVPHCENCKDKIRDNLKTFISKLLQSQKDRMREKMEVILDDFTEILLNHNCQGGGPECSLYDKFELFGKRWSDLLELIK